MKSKYATYWLKVTAVILLLIIPLWLHVSCSAGLEDAAYEDGQETEDSGGNNSGDNTDDVINSSAAMFNPLGFQGAKSENYQLTEATLSSYKAGTSRNLIPVSSLRDHRGKEARQ